MSNIKRLNLIVAHTDIVNVLSELIELECLEPTEPDITLEPKELTDLLSRESMELEPYDANFDTITLLSTQYTYFLTGWVPVMYEEELDARLSKHICAWEIVNISPDDADNAPFVLKYPQLFGKMRSGGRRIFTPLSKSYE